jgi:hypothetical protein
VLARFVVFMKIIYRFALWLSTQLNTTTLRHGLTDTRWRLVGFVLATASVFLIARFSYFFVEIHMEHGDFAANALKITHAKSFSEIYGNYSRFTFQHPGPIFFYVYAFGDALLFDFLRLVPSPHSAHAISGLFIQTCFFCCSLLICRVWIRHPAFLPLALSLASIHYYLLEPAAHPFNVHSPFYSIWAPNVLLFPFLCLLVACISLSLGRLAHLLPAALAAGFLLQGHVAQPLFVLPLLGSAYGLCLYGHWTGKYTSSRQQFIIVHRIFAVLVIFFALPVVIDLTRGSESNLSIILGHIEKHQGDHKTLQESVLYFLAFFGYFSEIAFNAAPDKTPALLGTRWYFYATWFVIVLAPLGLACWQRRWLPAAAIAFRDRTWIFLGFAIGLTLLWGTIQDGPMHRFNAYFNFSILFLLLILLTASVCFFIPVSVSPAHTIGRRVVLAAYTLPIFLTLYLFSHPPVLNSDFFLSQVSQAIHNHTHHTAHQSGKGLIHLKFAHSSWDAAASVALALQRTELLFTVDDSWGFLFGKRYILSKQEQRIVSIWTVTPQEIRITPSPS